MVKNRKFITRLLVICSILLFHLQAQSNGLIFSCRTTDHQTVVLEKNKMEFNLRFGFAKRPSLNIAIPEKDFSWLDLNGTGDGGNDSFLCLKKDGKLYQLRYGTLNHAPFSIDGELTIYEEEIERLHMSCVPRTIRFKWEKVNFAARTSMGSGENGMFCPF